MNFAGEHRNSREHYMLITAYNEALLETNELDRLDSELLAGHSALPFSKVTRKCSDDSIIKRRGLQLSRSSPPEPPLACTSPPPRSCRSTPTTPLHRAGKPGGVSGVEPPDLCCRPGAGNQDCRPGAGNQDLLNSRTLLTSPLSSLSDCSLDNRDPNLEHNFQNILHTREEWI